MGGCCSVSLSCDQVLNQVTQWLCVKESYIHNLEENLTALETAMEELKGRRDDLSRTVEREEMKGLRRLAQVQVWLTRVETIENQVNDLFSVKTIELQRLCFCGFCSKSLKLSYRYGKRVFMMLKEVESLKSNGIFEVVAEQPQASEVVERPIQPTIVGRETILETAWNRLMEDGVGIIGLYGMGGVGKTTLLTQINNKLDAFDFVIWVVVSKDLQIQKIQEDIAKKLGLASEEWNRKDEDQKACVILNVLKRKKFVLLLDDIWEKVDLSKIGVPFPSKENKCKVVFSTCSQEVCGGMGVDVEMEVQCLAPQDALDLFRKKVGEITLSSHPNIPELAIVVAKKCHGLPLALNVIGEAMACKRTIQEWRHAIDVLTSYATEFSGMDDKILPLLKYSYDNLKEEHYKSCLLYCALFPEDYSIPKQKLIEYWIGEGILDGSGGIERAENKGYEIIGSLVRASLLMEEVDMREHVSMHDVVREMALWIASDLGKQKEAFIVRSGVGLDKMPEVKNWNVVRRMSLMNNKIDHLVGEPDCLELTTLFIKNNSLKTISREFFKSMPKLVVLDLSDNDNLCVLPEEISELVSLQYLNLSETSIHHLPVGLQKLKELTHLDLEFATNLASVAGISSLHSLRVLKLYLSWSTWDHDTMEELENLEHLQVLTLEVNRPVALEKFLSSHRLTSCTRLLLISNINVDTSGIVLPATMDKLCRLIIQYSIISEIKMVSPLHNMKNLSKVHIDDCTGLKELTWLMFAPNLKVLSVYNVNQLEDIINEEKGCESEESGTVPFSTLINLKLDTLPKLKNIYWSPLSLPCLKVIQVIRCPNLKKLPLNSQSGEKGLVINYSGKEWIEAVEWEDEATKTRFLSSCKHV